MSYRYPDPGDCITVRMIAALSDPQRWDEEEREVLQELRKEVEQLVPPRALLDVGAGTGRVTWSLSDLLASADLLEPDRGRAREARTLARQRTPTLKVGVFSTEDDVPDRAYDVVLLSHVIQHVIPAEADRLLTYCAARCRSDGIIYLATALATEATSQYRVSTCRDDGSFAEEEVDVDRFIHDVRHPADDQLPARRFTVSQLEAALLAVGFEPVLVRPFHRVEIQRDQTFRDVALIGRKAGRTLEAPTL
jgi:SAM-dependent methyltransferase